MHRSIVYGAVGASIVAGLLAWNARRTPAKPAAAPVVVTFAPPPAATSPQAAATVAATVAGQATPRQPAPPNVDAPPRSHGASPTTTIPSGVWSQQLRDELCSCKDRACIREVDARYAAELSIVQYADADRETIARASHEAGECKAKILNAG